MGYTNHLAQNEVSKLVLQILQMSPIHFVCASSKAKHKNNYHFKLYYIVALAHTNGLRRLSIFCATFGQVHYQTLGRSALHNSKLDVVLAESGRDISTINFDWPSNINRLNTHLDFASMGMFS